MRISEMLNAIASWLESPNNEALLLAEYHEDSAKIVAESCVLAAALLKNAADEVSFTEPPEPSKITPEAIEDIAVLAAAFDASGDPGLKKQASVLDELLLSIAAPPNAYAQAKESESKRINELKSRYEDPAKRLAEVNKIADSEKAIEKSNMTKEYRVMEAPLSTRYCPDHPGVQISRIGEQLWQCELDKKSYNFETGFELNNGAKVPGGDVNQQTQGTAIPAHAIFDTREGRLGSKNANSKNALNKVAQPAPKDSDNEDEYKPSDEDKWSDFLETLKGLTEDENDARRIVQVPSSVPKAGFSTEEPEVPETLGDPESGVKATEEFSEWDFLKECVNSPEWKAASHEQKIKLLEQLKRALQAIK